MNAIIDFFLENRWLALFCAVAMAAGGTWAMLQVPIDAFPDLTNNQVVIFTETPTELDQALAATLQSVRTADAHRRLLFLPAPVGGRAPPVRRRDGP